MVVFGVKGGMIVDGSSPCILVCVGVCSSPYLCAFAVLGAGLLCTFCAVCACVCACACVLYHLLLHP